MDCDSKTPHDLVIHAVPMVADFLMPALMEVAAAHPTLCCRYRPSLAIQNLTHTAADDPTRPMAIALRGGNAPQGPGLTVRRLGLLSVGIYASALYVMRHGKADTAADLAGHILIHQDGGDRAPWEHWLSRHAPPGMRYIMRSDDEAAKHAAVRSGHCAAFMPISSLLFNSQLRTVMAPREEWGAALWLVAPECNTMSSTIATAIEMLGDRLARALGTT